MMPVAMIRPMFLVPTDHQWLSSKFVTITAANDCYQGSRPLITHCLSYSLKCLDSGKGPYVSWRGGGGKVVTRHAFLRKKKTLHGLRGTADTYFDL